MYSPSSASFYVENRSVLGAQQKKSFSSPPDPLSLFFYSFSYNVLQYYEDIRYMIPAMTDEVCSTREEGNQQGKIVCVEVRPSLGNISHFIVDVVTVL